MTFSRNFRDYGTLNANGKPRFPFLIPVGAVMHPLWVNSQVATDDAAKYEAHGLTFVAKPVVSVTEYMVHQHESYMELASADNLPLLYSTVSQKLWFVSAIQTPQTIMPVSALKIETPGGIIRMDESWTRGLDLKYVAMLKLLNTDYVLVEFPELRSQHNHPMTTYWGFAIFIR